MKPLRFDTFGTQEEAERFARENKHKPPTYSEYWHCWLVWYR